MFLCIISSVFCVFSRAMLAVVDRKVFCHQEYPFFRGILLNSLFPLSCAIFFFLIFCPIDDTVLQWIGNPGIILSGFGAQLSATAMSMGLRRSAVRSIMITSKSSDFLIPLVVMGITGQAPMIDRLLFSQLTTLAFLPLAVDVLKRNGVHVAVSVFIIGSLLFQASVSSLFALSQYVQTFADFLRFMVCVLFWRTLFVLLAKRLIQLQDADSVQDQKNAVAQENIGQTPGNIAKVLCIRGVLAFFSQASFFYAISCLESLIAWPILNAGPLLNCYVAQWLLKEKVNRSEHIVLTMLFCITVIYIIRCYAFK